MAERSGQKAIIAALVANAGIAVAKLVAFLVTGAASMLAESIHSVADFLQPGPPPARPEPPPAESLAPQT